jgi:hypothetical protein
MSMTRVLIVEDDPTTVVALAGLGVFLLAAQPGWAAATLVGGLMAAGLVAFAWWQQAWPPLEYRHASYRVDANGLEIRRGVYFRAVTNVPRSRVQHTDVSQGPVSRRFGLGTLIIYTAGTEFARVAVPGLEYGMATWIRDMLLPKHGSDAV